jgi:outer membrane protein OmpA-like peptidoglycan-associated protein
MYIKNISILLLMLPLMVSGQQEYYKWNIKGYMGTGNYYNSEYSASDYMSTDNNFLYRLELMKYLGRSWAISAGSTFGDVRGFDPQGNSFLSESRSATLRLYFLTDNGWLLGSQPPVALHLFGGLGMGILKSEYLDIQITNGEVMSWSFGAGLKFRLTERVRLHLQGEAVYPDGSSVPLSYLHQNEYNDMYFHTGIGLSYSFGFKRPSFTAPRIYSSDFLAVTEEPPVVKPRQNLAEAILKVEPLDLKELPQTKKDSILFQRPEVDPSVPDTITRDTIRKVTTRPDLYNKVTINPDSVKPAIKEPVEIREEVIIKDTTIQISKKTILPDSILNDTIKIISIDKAMRDTTFVVTDSLPVTLIDTTLQITRGDSVIRKVSKLKTATGKDSVVIDERIRRVKRDTVSFIRDTIKTIPAETTGNLYTEAPVTMTIRATKKLSGRDTIVIRYDTVWVREPVIVRDTVVQQTPVIREYKQPDEYVEMELPIDEELRRRREDAYYRRNEENLKRYESPKTEIKERVIYVPLEVSGGYLTGVKPGNEGSQQDTISWSDARMYFDSLQAQNRALMLMVDSLNQRLSGDQISADSLTDNYYWMERPANAEREFYLDYIRQQAVGQEQLRVRFEQLAEEVSRLKQPAVVTSSPADSLKNEIRMLRDSMAVIRARLADAKTPKPAPPVFMPETTVYFQTGSNSIPPGIFTELASVADAALKNRKLSVLLEGYSDLSGNPKTNLVLSRQRAETVSRHLQRLGVQSSQITVKYYGDTRATEKSNPLDRKVEVKIIQ